MREKTDGSCHADTTSGPQRQGTLVGNTPSCESFVREKADGSVHAEMTSDSQRQGTLVDALGADEDTIDIIDIINIINVIVRR